MGTHTRAQDATLHPGLGTGSKSGFISNVVEGLAGRMVNASTKAYGRPALRDRDFKGPLMLLDLEATGAFSITSYLLPHVTRDYSTMRVLPADLVDTLGQIDVLKDLPEGWNGHDVAAPKIEAIQDATEWIEQMYEDVVRSELAWRKPHVAADENGDVTFEWWNGDKGLTIYVSANGSVSYLKDWGPDIVDDMEDGLVSTPEKRREMWAWFVRQ